MGIVDPEPVVVTVTKEVPVDIPEKFTEACEDSSLLPYGSTWGQLINHSNDRYVKSNKCSDKIDELRSWNDQDRSNSNE